MIKARIEQFLKASGMSATRFGRAVAQDPRLVHDMWLGRQLGPRMVARIEAYLGDHA